VYLPDSFEPLALQVGTLAQSPSPIGMGEVGGEGRGEGLAAPAQAGAAVLVTEDIGQGINQSIGQGIDQGVGRNGERGNEHQRYGSQPHDTAYSASASLDTQRPATALHSGEYAESSASAFASASATSPDSFSLYWYQNDPNGCPVRLLWAASYTAWAEVDLLHTALIDNPIRLQGQYADPETGLYYNRHRYFCPHAGQFVSQDPLRLAGGLSLFGFGVNAVQWIDPLGLSACKVAIGEGQDRVDDWAHRNGALTIRSDPDFFIPKPGIRGGGIPKFNDAEKALYKTDPNAALLAWNKRWIQTKMDDGCEVHDLGRLGTRNSDYYQPKGSNVDFYGMERSEVFGNGYHFSGNYHDQRPAGFFDPF
jgi:RHS repeat-associated protein